jgi:hypothetical protein
MRFLLGALPLDRWAASLVLFIFMRRTCAEIFFVIPPETEFFMAGAKP